MSTHTPHRMIDGIEHKWCGRCQAWKPLVCFGGRLRSPDGQMGECRECNRDRVSAARKRRESRRRRKMKHDSVHLFDVVPME